MLDPRYVNTSEAPERRGPLERAGFHAKRLDVGDVAFPEAGGEIVLVENKRLYQFLEDMKTGQLMEQLRRLVRESEFPWLTLEGPFNAANGKFLEFPGFTVSQFQRQLFTIQDMGVRWTRTNDAADTVGRILDLADYYSKGHHESEARHTSGDYRVDALCRIRGVGEKRAKAILAVYPTLRQVAELSAEEIAGSVEEIGPVVARDVERYFTGAV